MTGQSTSSDIALLDKKEKVGVIVDVVVPLKNNIRKTEHQKVKKYQNLAIELSRIYELRNKNKISEYLEDFSVKGRLEAEMQKAIIRIIQTCHVIKKFLSIG